MIYTWHGGACSECGARSDLLIVYQAAPLVLRDGRYSTYGRARCVDRRRCEARKAKRDERGRTRRTLLVLAEPRAPDAPLGTCKWCGAELMGLNASRRSYCYQDRDGRDCRGEEWRSRCWTARQVVEGRGDPCCVDCSSESEWEADHQVALEDGGEHSLENIVRRCVPCHRTKTAAENVARARRRRPASAQLTIDEAA